MACAAWPGCWCSSRSAKCSHAVCRCPCPPGGRPVLLLASLHFPRCANRRPIVRNFMLAHLSLLFIPVGVGVMTHLRAARTVRAAACFRHRAVDLDRAGRDGAQSCRRLNAERSRFSHCPASSNFGLSLRHAAVGLTATLVVPAGERGLHEAGQRALGQPGAGRWSRWRVGCWSPAWTTRPTSPAHSSSTCSGRRWLRWC